MLAEDVLGPLVRVDELRSVSAFIMPMVVPHLHRVTPERAKLRHYPPPSLFVNTAAAPVQGAKLGRGSLETTTDGWFPRRRR